MGVIGGSVVSVGDAGTSRVGLAVFDMTGAPVGRVGRVGVMYVGGTVIVMPKAVV